jgi:hypothetical protein
MTKEKKSSWDMVEMILIGVPVITVVVFLLLFLVDMKSKWPASNPEHIEFGQVVEGPRFIAGDIWEMKIGYGKDYKALVFPAITAHPEQFPVGTKAGTSNKVTPAEGGSPNMLRIALLPCSAVTHGSCLPDGKTSALEMNWSSTESAYVQSFKPTTELKNPFKPAKEYQLPEPVSKTSSPEMIWSSTELAYSHQFDNWGKGGYWDQARNFESLNSFDMVWDPAISMYVQRFSAIPIQPLDMRDDHRP